MQWIDTPADLNTLSAWSGEPAVAVDTEFMREKTFFPELALVQLGRAGEVLLLDAPALGSAPASVEFLGASTIKGMHSASEELQAFHHTYAALPRPLFDTQLAAGLCGMDPGMSYQRLVASLCDIVLEKGETRSDWLKRPLTQAQLTYAADDVRYLLEPHRQLASTLDLQGRRAWLDEDCERMLSNAIEPDDPHPHLALRPAQGLPTEAQARLRRLLLWRDGLARGGNRPRNWVLDAGLALDLVNRPPPDRTAFEAALDRNPKSPRRRRDELFELLMATLTPEELDIPLATLPENTEREQLKLLQAAVAEHAKALGLHESVLASRRHLETLLREGRWSRQLSGWRRIVLEPTLVPLLPTRVRAAAAA